MAKILATLVSNFVGTKIHLYNLFLNSQLIFLESNIFFMRKRAKLSKFIVHTQESLNGEIFIRKLKSLSHLFRMFSTCRTFYLVTNSFFISSLLNN